MQYNNPPKSKKVIKKKRERNFPRPSAQDFPFHSTALFFLLLDGMEHQAARHHPTKENKIEKASDRISSIKNKEKETSWELRPYTFPSIFAVVFLLLSSSTFCWFTHLKLKLILQSQTLPFQWQIPQQNSIFLSSFLIFHVFYSSTLWVSSHSSVAWCLFSLARLMILCSWALAMKIQERILVIISTQLSPLQDFARLKTMMAFEEEKIPAQKPEKQYRNQRYLSLCFPRTMLLQHGASTSSSWSWMPGELLGTLCCPYFTIWIHLKSGARKGDVSKRFLHTRKASRVRRGGWKNGGQLLEKLQMWQGWFYKTGTSHPYSVFSWF